MTEEGTQYYLIVDGATHVYPNIEDAAHAWVGFTQNRCGATVSASHPAVKQLAVELLYGKQG